MHGKYNFFPLIESLKSMRGQHSMEQSLTSIYKEIQVRAIQLKESLKNEGLQKCKTKEQGRYFVSIQMQNPSLAEGIVGVHSNPAQPKTS